MEPYQQDYLKFIHERGALRFEDFQTKSGRLSPYYFNAGGLSSGSDVYKLGQYYAQAIVDRGPQDFNVLFGPAYKGIPLSVTTVSQLSQFHGKEIGFCFNRKEAKDHGEGGSLVGRIPQPGDRVVIIDDVITAGTSIRESMEILTPIEGVEVEAIVVSVDRQERGLKSEHSAIRELELELNIPVISIIGLSHIIEGIEKGLLAGVGQGVLDKITEYQKTYGA